MTDAEFAFVLDVKGNVIKRDKNMSEEAERVIELSNNYVDENRLEEVFQLAFNFEKEARNAADFLSYSRVILNMLDVMDHFQLWDTLTDTVVKLSKRRGQFKQAIVDIVQRCVTFIDHIEDRNTRINFIKTLIQVSENKIYVENELARLSMILSKDAEERQNIDEAFNFLRDLQVESYGDMPIEEKNTFMLEQCRLCLLKNDLVRAQIISNKIVSSTIDGEKFPDLKFKYYQTMMKIKFLQKAYVEVVQIGISCIELKIVDEDPLVFSPIFKTIILCLFLCPLDQTRKDLSIRVSSHRHFIGMDLLRTILEKFMVEELISWSDIEQKYVCNFAALLSPPNFSFFVTEEEAKNYLTLFRSRVNEHNLIVIQHCYCQISMARLSQLLHLDVDETEVVLCRAVCDHVVFARINRPLQIVVFKPVLSSTQILNEYLMRIENLFNNIGHVSTLINTESEFRKSAGQIEC
ncbi:26S proteasome non-ATPase regulatory subunit 12 [Thelohanellus kitauei]|uniref:26S proteasome non-ATPase regulatory subunit 12 n=1 Tax=Thelohanellus kitauei TaxID=669202 RepID=A0A0C2N6L8_THEKT|nr:26S proteasome non-ATPase regulatory subunit 12 [Thelohanellus kitauei]